MCNAKIFPRAALIPKVPTFRSSDATGGATGGHSRVLVNSFNYCYTMLVVSEGDVAAGVETYLQGFFCNFIGSGEWTHDINILIIIPMFMESKFLPFTRRSAGASRRRSALKSSLTFST